VGAGAFCAISAVALELSIVHSQYDSQSNRAPAARIAVAAAALVPALVALLVASRGHPRTARTAVYLALLVASAILVVVWGLTELVTGRL
jgi:protein-S-isoprenylcysteine O-methyltransferase Ste14